MADSAVSVGLVANGDDISLRPIVLGPTGGSNPFARFGKGAGFGMKGKPAAPSGPTALGLEESAPKKNGERVKYSKEFLLQFMEKYNKPPIELQQINAEFVVSGEVERDQQRAVLLKVAEEVDDRDWRTRDAAAAPLASAADGAWEPKAKAQGEQQQPDERPEPKERPKVTQQPASKPPAEKQPQAQPQPAASGDQEVPKIQRAADVGREAYRPGAALSAEQRAIRTIKGILNKLTPEKFERLLQQLLEVITTADILQQTIALIFESAVEQPTYCAMYADLCVKLSKELPSFPPPPGQDKPLSFRQILLNTCQDEFEGTEAARESLRKITDPAEKESTERIVKKRTLGNMRLISELYKQDMVKDWIMCTCIEDLLQRDSTSKALPPEDNIEAACEMISTAGAKLAKSDRADTRAKLNACFQMLAKLAQDSRVASRIRFLIKDLEDLRKANWVARREVFTAKKLEDVRAQAEAELGMISSTVAAALPALVLPAQTRPGASEDFVLIPPLRGETDTWSFAMTKGGAKSYTGNSALIGDYQPLPARQAAAAPAAPPAAPAASTAPKPAPAASPASAPEPEEKLKQRTESLLQEYTSTLDKAEAVTCVRELAAPEFMVQLVQIGLDTMMNSMKDKDQAALAELLLHFHAQGLVADSDLLQGLRHFTEILEDLSLDIPKAPSLLGQFYGSAVQQGVLQLDTLPGLLEGDFGAEPKRTFTAAALKHIKAKVGEDKLHELATQADLHVSKILEADPQLDGDLPSVEQFLKSEGLSVVPL